MRPQFFLSLLALVARPAVSDVAFIYRPAFVSTVDFSSNAVMVEGDFKLFNGRRVEPKKCSVTIFQLNATQFIGGPGYFIQKAAPDTLSTTWTVNKMMNLTISPPLIQHRREFHDDHDTQRDQRDQLPDLKIRPLATTTPVTSPPVVVTSSGLSIGVKAVIAAGVVGAALIGVLAGRLILGRRKINDMDPPAPAYPPLQASYYGPLKVEQQSQQYPYEVGSEPPPVRYELLPEMRKMN